MAAKKPAKGMLSKPPASLHRQNINKAKKAAKGGAVPGNPAATGYDVNQGVQNQAGMLNNYANQQFGNVEQAYSQPFEFNGPAAPVGQDYQAWVEQQQRGYNNAFDARMNPVFSKEDEDFDQMASNKGWDRNGELYKQQYALHKQAQNDARTQAYAAGQGQAVDSAGQLFNVGQQAHQSAYGEQLDNRNRPYNEFAAVYGAQNQSPYFAQNALNSQQNFQANQNQLDRNQQKWMLKNTPRGGGGGGGGAGAQPAWIQRGFGTYQDMVAFDDARARGNQQWEWDNQPRGAQPPSQGAGLIGGIAGAALGGWAQSGFKPFW